MTLVGSSWTFEEQDFRRADVVLRALARDTGARCVLLVDRSGQLVAHTGESPALDTVSFASLAAADFSANDRLAALVGEHQFASLFHQGDRASIYLADVAGRVVLVVLFDSTTTLGMIRFKAKGAVRELDTLFGQLFLRQNSGAAPARLEQTFAREAEAEIDRLFGEL